MSAALAPLFASLSHGVYVIGVADGGRKNAFTAAWLMQASFDPPLLALSINPQHASYAMLKAGGGFTVNVLKTGQRELAAHFAQPLVADKLAGMAWREARHGAPVFDFAIAWFECEWIEDWPAGDHRLVLGRVSDGGLLDEGAKPMDYREVSDRDASARLLPQSLTP